VLADSRRFFDKSALHFAVTAHSYASKCDCGEP
jgi:hypothetical protein